jgi:hypothetical protein
MLASRAVSRRFRKLVFAFGERQFAQLAPSIQFDVLHQEDIRS